MQILMYDFAPARNTQNDNTISCTHNISVWSYDDNRCGIYFLQKKVMQIICNE